MKLHDSISEGIYNLVEHDTEVQQFAEKIFGMVERVKSIDLKLSQELIETIGAHDAASIQVAFILGWRYAKDPAPLIFMLPGSPLQE